MSILLKKTPLSVFMSDFDAKKIMSIVINRKKTVVANKNEYMSICVQLQIMERVMPPLLNSRRQMKIGDIAKVDVAIYSSGISVERFIYLHLALNLK